MADLFGTYDKRIKLTISNTNIDATLTWFPVTVHLASDAGEEVFVELDADTDFDKCAFTKSDGTTELYADCELYDVSEEKAIYHVSLDGWEIADDGTTDFYMYYDDDASANTSYISASGGTAAQSVYDANFKAVYHMNNAGDANIAYDTKYEATVEPDSDGWTLVETDYSSSDGDILTIDTSANDNLRCSYYKTPDVDFDSGFYLKTRIKASTDMNTEDDYLYFVILDGTQNERVIFGISNGGFYSTNSVGSPIWTALDTTTDYVVYELYVKGASYWFYADGVLKDTDLIHTQVGTDRIEFGDIATVRMCKAEIDYVYYALGVRWNPAIDTTILDSTSNANDGTKKGAGEPAEATGQVGQGQDFDGGDDIVDMGDASDIDFADTTDFTVEGIIDTTMSTRGDILGKGDALDTGDKKWWAVYIYEQAGNGGDYVVSGFIDDGTNAVASTKDGGIVNDGSPHHFAVVFDRDGNMSRFIDGALSGTENAIGAVGDISSADAFRIGTRGNAAAALFDGIEDEIRISNTIRIAAWEKATKHTLFDNILTYGNEETSGVVVDNAIFFGCNF